VGLLAQIFMKIYRNPARNAPVVIEKYVPNYKKLNIEPEYVSSSATGPLQQVSAGSRNNPRERLIGNTQTPYAEPADDGGISMPNVGVDKDQIWTSLDGEIVEDIDLEYEGMYNTMPNDINNHENSNADAKRPDVIDFGDYSLFIFGELYSSGSLEEIQSEAASILYGENEDLKGLEIGYNDITVMKKVVIKCGVFIEG